ncbi:MAG: hypothetical protein V3T17_01100 [Pseudomonadales bacterium]
MKTLLILGGDSASIWLGSRLSAEGGLAWKLGRFLTSRRWLKRNTIINSDKIICWEHTNFSDIILNSLNEKMLRNRVKYWSISLPSLDVNLVIMFDFENTGG